MLENKLRNIAAGLVLSAATLAEGCAQYLPMNVQTARLAKQLPDQAQKKLSTVGYDGFLHSFEDSALNYHEYKVSLFSAGNIITQFQTIESRNNRGKEKWLVMYPILGGDDLLLLGYIARNVFAERGINSAIVLRKEQAIPNGGPFRPFRSDDPTITDLEDYVENMLKDGMRVIKYIKEREADFGLMGISFGGMQVVGIAPFFPESKINVVVMTGGDIAEILMNSTEVPVKQYRDYWAKELGGAEKLQKLISQSSMEPLRFAPYISTDKTRMVITTNDDAVPTKTQWILYNALGKPTTLTVPTNHYTLMLYYLPVRDFIVEEVEKSFGRE